jgi:hypothetical protein
VRNAWRTRKSVQREPISAVMIQRYWVPARVQVALPQRPRPALYLVPTVQRLDQSISRLGLQRWWSAVVDYDRRPRGSGGSCERGNASATNRLLVQGLATPRRGDTKTTTDARKVAIPHRAQRREGPHESQPAIGARARGR